MGSDLSVLSSGNAPKFGVVGNRLKIEASEDTSKLRTPQLWGVLNLTLLQMDFCASPPLNPNLDSVAIAQVWTFLKITTRKIAFSK
jgi:hypothetical protein